MGRRADTNSFVQASSPVAFLFVCVQLCTVEFAFREWQAGATTALSGENQKWQAGATTANGKNPK